jgi:hypothetical protein
MKEAEAAPEEFDVNDDVMYDSPDSAKECIERNEAEYKQELSAGQESSTHMSLKDNKELQHPIQAVEYQDPAFASSGENV